MEKVKVALVRTTEPYEGVRKLMSMLPNLPKIKGKTILVKPNLNGPFPPDDIPSNTHPDVLGAIIRYLREEGARKVLVGDEPVWGLRSRVAQETNGTRAIVEKEGGVLIHIDELERVDVVVPGGRMFEKISLPKILEEVDVVVNVPKLKINMMAQVSLAVKNLFGLMTYKDRKKYHRGFDLCYVLIDILKVVPSQINIIDGIYAMEGMSAHSGTKLKMELLAGSTSPVALDIVGSQIMGFNPMEIITTQLALKDKMGLENLDQIEVVGEPLESFRHVFVRPRPQVVHPAPNVEVIPGGICPGCTGRLSKIPPTIDPDKKYAVILGRRAPLHRLKEFDEIWCFGDCGMDEAKRIEKRFPSLKGKLKKVPGCPPLNWWAEHTLKEELVERGWWKTGAIKKA